MYPEHRQFVWSQDPFSPKPRHFLGPESLCHAVPIFKVLSYLSVIFNRSHLIRIYDMDKNSLVLLLKFLLPGNAQLIQRKAFH